MRLAEIRRPSPLRLGLELAALAVVAWLAVAALFGRWEWRDWQEPHWLEGDPLEVYARVVAAGSETPDGGSPLDRPPRLGAPFGADWTGYVTPDRLVFRLTGLLAREVGVVAAVQLMAAVVFVLNALSFHLCARRLGRRWEWAAALALAFAFAGSNVRWGVTLSLGQTFTLPPLVLLCAHAARRAPARGTAGWSALGAALGAWLGLGNPYLAYFAGVVAGGALVLALVRRAGTRRLAPLAAFLVVLSGVFLAANARYLRSPEASVVARGPGDFSRYALRPAEWFVPPADHRVPALARWGEHYRETTPNAGEPFYNYVGVAGAAGLLALAASRLRTGRRLRPRLDPLVGLGWILAFGVAGGVNTLVAAAGVDFFRAGTRIGVFALVWALLHLSGALARATRAWPRAGSVALAAALAGFACWEQTPALADRRGPERNHARWEAYRDFTARLERALPAGAQVFQLPAMRFPEAGRTVDLADYKHFLPYLTSRTLAFSYGHLASSREHRWVRRVRALPPAELVAELERTGFEALWIDRRGFAEGARTLVAALRAMGREEIAAPASLPVVVFRLRPADPAVLPDRDDPRLADPWDDREPRQGAVDLLAPSGWWPAERAEGRHWRWSPGSATLDLWNGATAARATLEFGVMGWNGTSLRLRVGGAERWSAPLRNGPARRHRVEVDLRPGLTRLEWELDGRPVQLKDARDRRLLGFALENVTVTLP